MNDTVESLGLMPRSMAEMVSKYNFMMVELRDPRCHFKADFRGLTGALLRKSNIKPR